MGEAAVPQPGLDPKSVASCASKGMPTNPATRSASFFNGIDSIFDSVESRSFMMRVKLPSVMGLPLRSMSNKVDDTRVFRGARSSAGCSRLGTVELYSCTVLASASAKHSDVDSESSRR